MAIPLVIFGAAVGAWLLFREDHPKIFISFAAEESRYRDFLVAQSKRAKVKFKLSDQSLHEPFDSKWKSQTREIIRECALVIVMVGSNTAKATGVEWEVKAAIEEGVRVVGVHVNKSPPSRVPQIMRVNRIKVIKWKHELLERELANAAKSKARRDS